jgi:hypothetical protein
MEHVKRCEVCESYLLDDGTCGYCEWVKSHGKQILQAGQMPIAFDISNQGLVKVRRIG